MRSRTRLSSAAALVLAGVIAIPAGAALGPRLRIPAIGLDVRVSYTSLDRNPMLWYQRRGTLAIAGHRVTHTHPFRHIERLARGDVIWLGRQRYVVDHRLILKPTATRRALHWRGLVLSACTPPGTALRRLVVFARRG